ncbi:hypothetical protein RIF29_00505 [Crotalaria pallida]|uniref:Transmembrane protein n=1 Tax=Crotalaria pallida TaxID=3830 RepID=A0AAN9IWK3_CROPI
MERGPSPLLPSLLVLGLGFVIYWSSLMSIVDMLFSIFQLILEASKSFITLVLLLVLFLIGFMHLPSSFPFFGKLSKSINYQVTTTSHDYDGFDFGFGTLLLVLLFIVLINLI